MSAPRRDRPGRLALVTPHDFPSIRGNSITVRRIADGLAERGAAVEVFALDRLPAEAALRSLRAFGPDLVHGFHATATGPSILEAGRILGVPVVITLTGTDVNLDLEDADKGPLVRRVLTEARAVVAFHEVVRRRVAALVPAAAPRTHVIAQAVRCPGEAIDLRGRLGFGGDEFVFLQAAGIRPVKNIPSVIPALSALHTRHPRVRYVLAGPVLEPAEGARVTELLRPLPWAACIGPLPHAELHAGLGSADVAINSSLSEGGMSNAVLEAMGQGVVVLASNIDGNRSVIVDGEDGFLYASEAEFVLKAERLLADAALRARVGQRARQKIRELFSPAAEISAHLGLYRGLLGLGEEG